MGRRGWFALALLVALVAAGLAAQLWLEAVCQRQTGLLERGQDQQAYALWQAAEPWMACLVGHEELNQAGDCYAELLALPPESRPVLRARLRYWLWALAQYDRPGIRSIL